MKSHTLYRHSGHLLKQPPTLTKMEQKYCDCEKCKNCCKNLAGIPLPNEVVKIAEFLNMPLSECLKKYFIVGWREYIDIQGKNYDRIDFVYPARKGWNNKIEDWGYPFGEKGKYCLFLENDLCKINEVKPYECLNVFGCKESSHAKFRNKALIEWSKDNEVHPEIKDFIKKVGG